jgi:tetratricopeptide (TPR) repeat protein
VTTPGRSSTPTTADILIDRFRKSGDTANLIVTLRKAVTDRPRDPKLRRELIGALRLRGWTEAARDEAARALVLCPETPELHNLLGQGYLGMGQFPEAMKELGEAVRLDPTNASYRVALGDAYLAQSKFAEAESAYKEALAADPKSPLPHFQIARLRAQALRFAEASDSLAQGRKAAGGGVDGTYATTYLAVLLVIDGAGQDLAGRLATVRKDFVAGTLNREQAHRIATECRDRASSMTGFVSDNAPPQGYATVQALYVQATALMAQASGVFASHLETRDEAEDREATLLRQEGVRLLTEATKKAKSQAP